MNQARSITGTSLSRRAAVGAASALAGLALSARIRSPFAGARTRAARSASDLETELSALVVERMEELLVPGAVALVRTPQLDYLRAFGSRSVETDEAATTDDHFRIASNTKTMTGTVLLQLVSEGLIALDDPVAAYQPDVPHGDNILVSQTLDMTSGIANHSELEVFNQALDDNPTNAWQPAELLELAFSAPPDFEPGAGYHYSNSNTVLAGVIAEQVGGRPLATLFNERIFIPLELSNTSFPEIGDNTIPDPHPRGYQFGTNVSTLETGAIPDAEIEAARAGDLPPNDVTDVDPSWAWAAGGAISTANDLATYVKALATGQLLEPVIQRQRIGSIAPGAELTTSPIYGLALVRFATLIGHTGSMPGFQTFMGHDPEADVTVIVLTNLQMSPEGVETANAIAMPLIAAIYSG